MRSWNNLGVTETIYEEDQEEGSKCSSLTPSPHCSHSSSSLLSSLQNTVEEWSRATGSKANMLVHVDDHCFHLHKDPLLSHSRYLRRYVAESSPSVVTISPPSTLTAETFAAVASFCYGSDIPITPFNVAALRVAAEWLDMAEDDDCDNPNLDGDGSLLERSEWYFCQTVASSTEHAGIVLRTCLALLPDAAESAAFLAGRCIEALTVTGGGRTQTGNPVWLDDLSTTTAEEFQMIADAIHDRLPDRHDLIYTIVDHYLENYSGGKKLTEDEKSRICSVVDCKKLSQPRLIHLVRNPRMPLRFVVQAMLIEQFHTRVSFFDRVCKAQDATSTPATTAAGTLTLGDILQRDAAVRQAQHLKATMEATYFRIQTLEQELSGMRRRLREGKREEVEEEEEMGSVRIRSESCRFFGEKEEEEEEEEERVLELGGNLKSGKGFGRRLVHGVRSVLRTAMRAGSESRSTSCSGGGDAAAVVTKKGVKARTHRRNRSFTNLMQSALCVIEYPEVSWDQHTRFRSPSAIILILLQWFVSIPFKQEDVIPLAFFGNPEWRSMRGMADASYRIEVDETESSNSHM